MMITDVKEKLKAHNPFNQNHNGINGLDSITASKLKTVAKLDKASFFSFLETKEAGLDEEQVELRQHEYGVNEVVHEKAPAWYVQFFQAFINPFIAVLIVIAIISFIMDVMLAKPGEGDFKTVIVVGVMVMLSSFLRFWQEFRSNKAAEQLKSM